MWLVVCEWMWCRREAETFLHKQTATQPASIAPLFRETSLAYITTSKLLTSLAFVESFITFCCLLAFAV